MVSVVSLWLPIVVAAVLVFVMSSIIHMFLTYHRTDFTAVPNEEAFRAAVGPLGVPPGEYVVPHAGSPDAMKSEGYQSKVGEGPVLFMTVLPNEMWNMGKSLLWWFVYCLVVAFFAALVATGALTADAPYSQVFEVAGLTAFAAYALGGWQQSVWYHRKVGTSLKNTFDGLLYAALTAGAIAGMWP